MCPGTVAPLVVRREHAVISRFKCLSHTGYDLVMFFSVVLQAAGTRRRSETSVVLHMASSPVSDVLLII